MYCFLDRFMHNLCLNYNMQSRWLLDKLSILLAFLLACPKYFASHLLRLRLHSLLVYWSWRGTDRKYPWSHYWYPKLCHVITLLFLPRLYWLLVKASHWKMVHCDDHYSQLEFTKSSHSIYPLGWPCMLVHISRQICSKYYYHIWIYYNSSALHV